MSATAAPVLQKVSPVTFAVAVLMFRLYQWQARLMSKVASGKPTACVTPNGAGKTSVIICALALWMLHEWPAGTVVLTSATFRAVREQIFSALHLHKDKFAGWEFKDTEIETPQGGRIVGFATDSGGRFEGFHAYPDRPLMIILDEAKTIHDDIFVAADRCQPTYLLYISSPGGLFGRFHDAFKSPRFEQEEIGIGDCPHITPEFIAAMREQYGEESDIYRSMIEGKFGKGTVDGKVVPFGAYENTLRSAPMWQPGTRQVFCDFSNTSDECVVAKRDGNRLEIVDAWVPGGNNAETTMRFARLLRPLQADGYVLRGDQDGTGHGYITALGQMGIHLIGVSNNAPAGDSHYFNLAAEMWWQFRRCCERCTRILPNDEKLKRQACSRDEVYREVAGKKVYGREDGKLQLMPKSKLSSASPDRADAIVGASFDYPAHLPIPFAGQADPNRGWLERIQDEEAGTYGIAGADCG